MTTLPTRRRVPLPDISSRAWEHPADRGALVALRRLRGFDTLIKKLSGLFNERALRLMYLGSAIRVDDRQFPRLHALLAEVASTLDSYEVPSSTSPPAPGARGRGAGAAVTWAATLADPEVPAVLVASDDGRPTYERMGYLPLERWTAWLRPIRPS